jgi:3-phosphoshikimate 1-carboxyvinyltransferase
MLRFLTATLAATEGVWRLDGCERLRQRPLGPLIAGLRRLGADIRYLGSIGHAPLVIRGCRLRGGRVEVRAAESSQYVSALVMAGTRADATLDIGIDALSSRPYLDLTLETVAEWGGRVQWSGPRSLRVLPTPLAGGRIRIEGDFSSACYFAAGAALLGGRLKLYDLRQNTRQGDRRFLDLLLSMGAGFRWGSEHLEVEGSGRLRAIERDMSDMPDQVPTLAAVAPFATGTTRITNVAHLRLKESDRLAEVARGLRTAGAAVEELVDGLVIPGVWAEAEPPESAVCLDSADDHRLAMSFALLGLRRPGISIAEPGVVAKSYPGFWRDFERCFEP